MNDDLPEGWRWTTLSELCEINPPKPRADALPADAPVTFVPMPAVDGELGAITQPEARPFSRIRNGYTAFRDGDVIMAKITPCMENGKAAVARHLENGLGFGSTEFHVLRSKEGVLPEFIYYFIRQETFRRAAELRMTGSVGQKRVPTDFLEGVEIPFPPLEEQRWIVDRLEELQPRIRVIQQHLDKIRAILKRFRQTILAAACSGRLTEDWRSSNLAAVREVEDSAGTSELDGLPPLWKLVRVKDVAQVQGGIQKQPKRIPRKNAYSYLRVANVLRGKLDLTKVLKMELFDGELETYRLEPMDLLIVEGNGSLREIGRSALWTGAIKDCVHQNHIIRVRARLCSAKYLNIYWNSPMGIERVVDQTVTTAGLYSLSTKKVANSLIPIPSLPEQEEIVRRVESLFALADQIEARCAQVEARVDKLTEAILTRAFHGELVIPPTQLGKPARIPS